VQISDAFVHTLFLRRWSAIQRDSRDARSSRARGPRINDQIRVVRVRVIDPGGQSARNSDPRKRQLMEARARGLDLWRFPRILSHLSVVSWISGSSSMNKARKNGEARKKQHVVELKEVRMRPKIDDHDFEVKSRTPGNSLNKETRVKVSVRFRGARNCAQTSGRGEASWVSY